MSVWRQRVIFWSVRKGSMSGRWLVRKHTWWNPGGIIVFDAFLFDDARQYVATAVTSLDAEKPKPRYVRTLRKRPQGVD